MTYLACPAAPAVTEYATVYIAWELSKGEWKLGVLLPGAPKMSRYAIAGGDLAAVEARLAAARDKAAKSGLPVRIVSCYEAGFEGHWLHRWLEGRGVISHEVDPASIEVNRRARRVKTDGIDLDRIMRAFLAHLRGEASTCSMVHVPSPEEEDGKRVSRERERLVKERTAHTNRIKALLHAQGIRDARPLVQGFLKKLASLRTGDGRKLPPRLLAEIVREHERLMLVHKQIAAIEAASKAECRQAASEQAATEQAGAPPARAKIVQLTQLKGIGLTSAQVLANEVFYRRFANRRQVGSCFGLTGTPYSSGGEERDQGISKAGNRRARTIAMELAWRWVHHQPESALTRWFKERVGSIKGRIRRIAIVALARKLMVALWRYLETGVVPSGAVLNPSF
ncbi:MAG: IS110 family transposase [Alphaproteobacteria bacterium]|nr:IS110 family transposase [Alphaproteobacteria bacterium]